MALIGDDPTLCPPLGRHRLGVNFGPQDGVAVGDSAAATVNVTPAEAVVLSEALAATIKAALADGVTLSELLAGRVINAPIADGVTLSELFGGRVINAPIADGVTLGELLAGQVNATLSDNAILSEFVSLKAIMYFADGVALNESERLGMVLQDGVTLSEALTGYNQPGLVVQLEPEPFNAAPVASVFQIAQGDTAPRFVFAITKNGYLLFTGAGLTVTAQFRLKLSGAATYAIDAPLTYQNGLFIHEFTSPQTDTPGEYLGEVTITFPDGSTMTTETFTLRIRESV